MWNVQYIISLNWADIAMTGAEDRPDFVSYVTLTGELSGVFCNDFGENWPRYKNTTMYFNNVD